ncbi:PAS domain-containing sensor histidine kinase [Dactylosporangium sp. NPDC051485]|uniref:PAS domain-containing sensor histidine kinase n=1 Tax=Dactylosporangium sp. NPDC051485 TaxID=3154846 RepID=UPI00343BC161
MHFRRRYVSVALAAAVLLLGVVATAGVCASLTSKERRSAAQAMDRQVDLAQAAVSGEVQRYLDTIDTVAGALGSHDVLTPDAFERATARVPGENLAGATAVVFVVPAATADVAAVQRQWRSAGAVDLTLRPAAGVAEHYFAVYGRQLDGREPAAGGADLAEASAVAGVLREARSLGGAAVSQAAVLTRDAGPPATERRRSLSLATPVLARSGSLRGFVLLGLRGEDFFGAAIGEVLQRRVTATLWAAQEGGGLLPMATVHPTAPPSDALRRSRDLGIAQRHWRLDLAADPRELPGAYTDRPLLAGAAGAVLTVLLAALVYLLSSRRAKALEAVREATRELRAAEREARDQAALQQAILTSVGEGVTVVGEDGRVLLHNPAARALLGTAGDAAHLEDWPAHYGAYLPDRVTPFPPGRLPMVRALRGVAVDREEMVIRNPAHPDGILLSVGARPLDRSGGGPRGAVAVLHDITELRRYETELAQFAAVVAHDLKSPLTAVHGFAAVAAEALAADPPRPQTAAAALVRVRQGATRMRVIIDDLLAYTTAGDAPLNVAEVDLRQLVESVVAERTAPRPAAGLSTAVPDAQPPAPSVWIGPLPAVRADAGLLRLVVDNLVGNAIKYTPAGRAPHVEITAEASAGGVRLEVADRGIGIPDEEKVRVFESFHRASPVEYGGTGLGLAICRRIVERHGGTIAVRDNPGGGTRVSVLLPPGLPAAATRRPADDWWRLQRAPVPAAARATNHNAT